MITDEKLIKLYDRTIEKTFLTTKDLNDYGFNFHDINELIKSETIERLKRGLYLLKSVDNLYFYGEKLIKEKKYDMATLCFEKCHEINPNHLESCFQLFLRSIKNENYIRAFELYDKLLESDNKLYKNDYNYYLYLLSMITDIPEKYKDYVKNMSFDDIKISIEDKRYSDIDLQNKIRELAFKKKFPSAVKLQKYETIQDIILKTLLVQAKKVDISNKKRITSLIKSKQYDEIIKYFNNNLNSYNLTITEKYILKLTEKIIEIRSTLNIPKKESLDTDNLFECIDNNDYEKALHLSNEYNLKYDIPNNSNSINLLLQDICLLIKGLTVEENQSYDVSNNNLSFSSILYYLNKNDTDKALQYLRLYLKSINQTNYEFLITNLIKISILEHDSSFEDAVNILSTISKGIYIFDISIYLQKFYISLSENNFSVAQIYLDIIFQSKKLKEGDINKLYQILTLSKIGLKKKENDSVQLYKDNEKSFIDQKYHELLERKSGIILLKPMNSERIDTILDMVRKYPNMDGSVVTTPEGKQIILRYKPLIKEHIDVKNLFVLGNQAYKNKDYDECIKNYLELLKLFKQPRSIIYAMLGLSYMKIKEKNLAIDYLTIATYLSKTEEEFQTKFDYDFTELILSLKGEIPKEEKKPKYIDIDFENDDDYNLDFDKINSYIFESGLDVESACIQLGLTSEEIDIIKLIYAKEYYTQNYFEMGDLFLKSFEKSKNKTQTTIKLFEKIKKSKKLYSKRKQDEPKKLTLTLKPKK